MGDVATRPKKLPRAVSALRISRDLTLPLDLVTEATAIVATRGAGKSSASAVLVEEAFAADVQAVVFDRTGVYWGLRSSASGDGPGLPIYVLGGPHGDAPLEGHAGVLIADLVVDSGHSFVLDLSDLSKGQATRFAADFLERLYDRKANARTTLLLVMDEAHFYAPQTPRGGFKGDSAKLMGAMEDVVGLGRSRGLGVVLTTQRTQALNKAVLDLIETLLVMRMLSPRARKAVKDWIQEKHEEDERGVIPSLDSLPTGTAWVWSPLRGILEKVALRRIKTFDSYATPTPGQTKVEPTVRRELDLDALGERMRETAERAKENDPAELRKRLRDAEEQVRNQKVSIDDLAARLAAAVEAPVEVVPAYTVGDLDEVWKLVQGAKDAGEALTSGLDAVAKPLAAAILRAAEAAETRPSPPARPMSPTPPARPTPAPRPRVVPEDAAFEAGTNGDIEAGAKHLLATLGQHHPLRLTVGQLALLARRKPRGGSWNTAMKQLRAGGYVQDHDGLLLLTDRGVAASGASTSLQGSYRERWREALGSTPAALDIFDRLLDAYPAEVPFEELAAQTNRVPRGGSWNTAIATLTRNGLAIREGDSLVATAEAAT